ncbi:TIGR01777 family oxidoreductase [Marinomonas arenicola]|uniref:TIGR01777 family oxidoreductase n=1 Tax=Marinomonas arenicola TaxID=569601 RepID=A0ABU9G5E6_9GAMM
MKILISGATGFVGTALTALLQSSGHQLFALVRHVDIRLAPNITQYTLETLHELDQQMDVFINLAGEGIADKPWSEKRKKSLYESRVTLTRSVKEQLVKTPHTVISMSAIGYYGSHSNAEVDEFSEPDKGFAHELCDKWEAAAFEFSELGARTVVFRLGVILGKNGGALSKMRPAYLCGLGGKIGRGNHGFSWVHLQDVLKGIVSAMLDPRFDGIYNLTAPECVAQKEFAKCYAHVLKRPAVFTTPNILLRLLFGEMSSLLTHGVKAHPKRLIEQGFLFDYKNLEAALMAIENKH